MASARRIVFFGTPEFAVPSLSELLTTQDQYNWNVVGVVTNPPKPVGRHATLTNSPIHQIATAKKIAIATPTTLKKNAIFVDWLTALQPDVAVLVAYGKILPKAVLDVPPGGFINVHPSLLPRHRGPSPIAGAILAGDIETGVTIMQLDEQMDHGPILAQERLPVAARETTGSLTHSLATLGAKLLVSTLHAYLEGRSTPRPQEHGKATVTKLLKKQDGELDCRKPAVQLDRHVRAMDPWPGAFICVQGKRLKVLTSLVTDVGTTHHEPGQIVKTERGHLGIHTTDGILELTLVQLAGSRPQTGHAFARGHQGWIGARCVPC